MTVTFATPLVQTYSKTAAVSAPKIFTSVKHAISKLWQNKGVQFGTGLAASGIGVSVLGSQTQEVTKPFGELGGILSPILLIGIVVIVAMLLLGGRR